VDPKPSWLDRVASGLVDVAARRAPSARRLHAFAGLVKRHGRHLEHRSDAHLQACATTLRRELRRHGLAEGLLVQCFALVREVAKRTLGMEPFDVQIIGGYVMSNGMLAEMETGEGKTLTATLPACSAALAGIPVHVVTANDYLVERDATLMAPLYEALGLSVGTVRDRDLDPESRRAAYGCDITYVTGKQLAFDYLRDRLLRGDRRARLKQDLERLRDGAPASRLLLRGLCFAIVDEADSILIDEARTPLLLSRTGSAAELERTCRQALALVAKLREGRDFLVDRREREIHLTGEGSSRVAKLASAAGGVWAGERRREQLVLQALQAEFLFGRDDHYLLREGQVEIIDPNTGRRMPDRAWEAGLHQMIEAKEGCEITGQRETLARISYQQFYRRYLRLAGMTGTAREVARELWSVYRLRTVEVPTHRPLRRQACGEHIHPSAEDKWRAIVERVGELHRGGRPVLIGTRSVAASEHLSPLLRAAGLQHELLNARQDRQEAEIIQGAGQPGRITVATNMAGRGADIRLGPGVEENGGLHVIATERSEARRIDRQLFGRCARQGDPGSFEMIGSVADEIVIRGAPELLRRVLARLAGGRSAVSQRLCRTLVSRAQRAVERRHARSRRELMKLEEYLQDALAFAGPAE
jgi:preprotein translocase subunit SecA